VDQEEPQFEMEIWGSFIGTENISVRLLL